MRNRLIVIGAAVTGVMALAAPAQADTTVGQTGGDVFSACGEQLLAADTNYVVPSGGGTITSFSYQSFQNTRGAQLDFLILRPAGGTNYTVIGKTGVVTLAGSDAVETFAANIPVQGGDILGFWPPDLLNSCWRNAALGTGGYITSFPTTTADPSVGDALSLPFPQTNKDLNLSANLVTTPTPTIAALIDSVEALDLPRGIENSLLKKLTNAQRNLDSGDSAGACDKLASFTSQVKAQKGKKITPGSAADDLVAEAEAVQESVGCG